eukprot:TRINITY_DN32229_c0_g1_i1.p1 TRINITY_DN32229_c0_g1~~TRINITY_DN32229_c0_g1_i1.p1  ORF type:complete len:1020 (+),score=175.17 TRINITY_DN32229_c0_g1_i1:38-3061(+)
MLAFTSSPAAELRSPSSSATTMSASRSSGHAVDMSPCPGPRIPSPVANGQELHRHLVKRRLISEGFGSGSCADLASQSTPPPWGAGCNWLPTPQSVAVNRAAQQRPMQSPRASQTRAPSVPVDKAPPSTQQSRIPPLVRICLPGSGLPQRYQSPVPTNPPISSGVDNSASCPPGPPAQVSSHLVPVQPSTLPFPGVPGVLKTLVPGGSSPPMPATRQGRTSPSKSAILARALSPSRIGTLASAASPSKSATHVGSSCSTSAPFASGTAQSQASGVAVAPVAAAATVAVSGKGPRKGGVSGGLGGPSSCGCSGSGCYQSGGEISVASGDHRFLPRFPSASETTHRTLLINSSVLSNTASTSAPASKSLGSASKDKDDVDLIRKENEDLKCQLANLSSKLAGETAKEQEKSKSHQKSMIRKMKALEQEYNSKIAGLHQQREEMLATQAKLQEKIGTLQNQREIMEATMKLEVKQLERDKAILKDETDALREICAERSELLENVRAELWHWRARSDRDREEARAERAHEAASEVWFRRWPRSPGRGSLEQNDRRRAGFLDDVAGPPACSEGHLRKVMTRSEATTVEMEEAISSVEALLNEAKHELSGKQRREKRAAFEALYEAIDARNEAELENALARARLVGVDTEDVEKAEIALAKLFGMTDEERARKRLHKLNVESSRRAFLYVKKDEDELLQTLLENLDDGLRWQDWKDHAGRTLLQCAHDLRATNVQQYLAGKLRIESMPPPAPLSTSVASSLDGFNAAPSESASPAVASDMSEPVAISQRPRRVTRNLQEEFQNESGNDSFMAAISSNPKVSAVPPSSPVSVSVVGGTSHPISSEQRCSAVDEPSHAAEACATSGSQGNGALAKPLQFLTLSESEELEVKTMSFRSVVKDDFQAIKEMIAMVPQDTWTSWRNKADKDLLTLAIERGASKSYSAIGKALGLVSEMKREVFEERESVWIMFVGEVQPQRATVLEYTPASADDVLIELWTGHDAPTRVQRSLVLKSH